MGLLAKVTDILSRLVDTSEGFSYSLVTPRWLRTEERVLFSLLS